jgi:hypothetical protein
MARQTGFKLSCTVGDIIYYKWKNDYYMRTKAKKVRQTKATKSVGKLFGKANRLEKVLRTTLSPVIPNIKDKNMMRRMVKQLYAWLQTDALQTKTPLDNIPFVTGFEYNEVSPLASRFKVPMQVSRTADGKLILHLESFIPESAITAPAYTKNIVCTIMAASCTTSTPAATGSYTTQLNIPYNNETIPAQKIPLGISTAPGNLTIVTVALEYYKGEILPAKKNRELRWSPDGIVEGLYN